MHTERTKVTEERAVTSFGELALKYFPDRRKDLASRAFSRWLSDNSGLIIKMQLIGWRRGKKTLTPKQIGLIYEEFGRP